MKKKIYLGKNFRKKDKIIKENIFGKINLFKIKDKKNFGKI